MNLFPILNFGQYDSINVGHVFSLEFSNVALSLTWLYITDDTEEYFLIEFSLLGIL